MIAGAGTDLAALATTGNPGTLSAAFASAEVFLFFELFSFFLRFAIVCSSLSSVFYERSVPARAAAAADERRAGREG